MSKKLAIAMFGQKRLSREGGVEIVVKELCTRMAQNGCDVFINPTQRMGSRAFSSSVTPAASIMQGQHGVYALPRRPINLQQVRV